MMRGSKGLQLKDWRKKGDCGGDSSRRAGNGPEELDKAIEELFLDQNEKIEMIPERYINLDTKERRAKDKIILD